MTSSTRHALRCAVDAERWPDVAVAEGSPVRATVARALFTRAVAALPLRVRFPDGRLLGAGPPGRAGRIGLQTITMPHDRMLATRHTYTWIQKYIFPGGLLPSLTAIENSLTSQTRLRITARTDFGPHYAETLRIWRDRFTARADQVARLGFDDVFARMWTFYLAYSEAGFRSGYIDVSQLTLARI